MSLPDDESRAILRSVLAVLAGQSERGSLSGAPVLEVVRRHRLSPLLATKGLADPALATACRQDRVTTAARNLIFGQCAAGCLRAFADANIPVIVLKGLAYETTIHEPGTRPTSDIDLLVPNAMRREAFGVMNRLGFEPRAAAPGFDEADYHEVAWTRQGIEVDLHTALAPFARCAIDYRAIWEEAIDLKLAGVEAKTLHRTHAAVFHALHMAIDHFDVPALYLVDFTRLLADHEQLQQAEARARAWRCWRPFATAVALSSDFLPSWPAAWPSREVPPFARDIVAGYGGQRIVRREQLVRKFRQFDTAPDAVRYLLVQGRRNLRELYERRIRKRSARERLALGS
jgi:hypothetical protein